MNPVRIDKIIPGGQAIGTLPDGKKAMLWNALPGELVTEWKITKNKSSYIEGIAEVIANPSNKRVKPKDNCYLATSPWQIMDYNYELRQKQEVLREILRQQKVPDDSFEIQAVRTDGRDFFYRNKMEYALYYDIERAQIFPAMRSRGTPRKLPLSQSSLEMPSIWLKATEIIDGLNTRHEEARRYQSLLLRSNQSGEVSGGLLENRKPHPKFDKLRDTILGQEYSYSPNGFFQINLPVYEMVLTEMQKWIKTDKVLDLYSGVGTIGLSVARDRDLILVECDKSAFLEMKNNCRGTHATPILAKSEEALGYINPDQTVIVDPPRAGCLPNVIEELRSKKPTMIIYLSCNPITQARDISLLLDTHEIKTCIPFNFFPRTPHLENLMILERKN